MQEYCNTVKNKLNMLIRRMEKNVSNFVANPKRDFVRKSELSFSKTMKFILGMGSQTLGKELMDFMALTLEWCLFQLLFSEEQRYFPQLFSICFVSLIKNLLRVISSMVTDFTPLMVLMCIYRLFPAIPVPIIVLMMIQRAIILHLNALYDLLNRRYIDAVLQDSRNENENKALISMLDNDSIIIADRNYDSYNNIAHLEAKGLKYVIRTKSKVGIVKKFDIPLDKEADFTADILLTRRQTNEVKAEPDRYRFLGTDSTFDFLPKGSKEAYPLKFRIVRIKIADDKYETLVTNLWDNEFSADDIKNIYKLRWGIETSFRELKYHIGLIAFHSKKKDCVIQEIFASLIMYNFSMLITENILIDDDKHNKYRSRVNYAAAIHICINFFRSDHVSPSDLEKLIARNKCPVRPDRNAARKARYHSAIGFNYRLS